MELNHFEVLDTELEVTLAWSRRIRFVYKKHLTIEADLYWSWDGYSLEVRDEDCTSDDPSVLRDLSEEVNGFRQEDLYQLDVATA